MVAASTVTIHAQVDAQRGMEVASSHALSALAHTATLLIASRTAQLSKMPTLHQQRPPREQGDP